MMVCSKRGPTIALSRGCWLLLQIPLRFGDCATRSSSPCSTLSWRTLSWLPSEEVGVALVAETGDLGWRPLGSLAGMGLSGVVLYALRRAGNLLGAARRVRESIMAVMWLSCCCWRGGRREVVRVELEMGAESTRLDPMLAALQWKPSLYTSPPEYTLYECTKYISD